MFFFSENYTKVNFNHFYFILFSLVTRKVQWKKEEEDRIANTPDPAMPPGHKVLPENERMQTLNLLKESKSNNFMNYPSSDWYENDHYFYERKPH